eukprot:2255870-Heterocapsa_arctica.AAC.1
MHESEGSSKELTSKDEKHPMKCTPYNKYASIVKYWVDRNKCEAKASESKMHKGHKKIAKLAKLRWNKSFDGNYPKTSCWHHKQRHS